MLSKWIFSITFPGIEVKLTGFVDHPFSFLFFLKIVYSLTVYRNLSQILQPKVINRGLAMVLASSLSTSGCNLSALMNFCMSSLRAP